MISEEERIFNLILQFSEDIDNLIIYPLNFESADPRTIVSKLSELVTQLEKDLKPAKIEFMKELNIFIEAVLKKQNIDNPLKELKQAMYQQQEKGRQEIRLKIYNNLIGKSEFLKRYFDYNFQTNWLASYNDIKNPVLIFTSNVGTIKIVINFNNWLIFIYANKKVVYEIQIRDFDIPEIGSNISIIINNLKSGFNFKEDSNKFARAA